MKVITDLAARMTALTAVDRTLLVEAGAGSGILAEDAGQTLGGMSLATASAKLAYGLWHLPELARDFPKQTSFMIERAPDRGFVERSDWGLELEFEPELRTLAAVMEKAVEIDPTLVKRSVLPPLTETDDPDFRARIRTNINLPAQFRECV
jgi:5-methylthioadenosine/S-adenosylhomocysteine deaminase